MQNSPVISSKIWRQLLIFCLLLTLTLAISVEEKQYHVCTMPPRYGNCGKRAPMWYYHPKKRTCFRFIWSLCGGNENRFYTKWECLDYCRFVRPTERAFQVFYD